MIIRPIVNGQGAAQQTAPAQLVIAGARPRVPSRRRTVPRRPSRKSARRASARPTARRATTKRPARLVKGSMAAKRYMASIRRKRRR